MNLRSLIAAGANVHPPKWLPDNLAFETIMGSDAYGVSSGASDTDIYGLAFPPKDLIFPHLSGEILGFGSQTKRFEQWQQHHIPLNGTEYDFSVYSIVKYFQLAMENNPNILDSLFTPRRCVLSSTQIGERIREQRRVFLHKGSWHKLKGYAYSQLNKIRTKTATGKRAVLEAEHGYDVKFAYHVVRLLLQAEQILVEGDLDLERHREQLKSIRRGEWPEEKLFEWAAFKEKDLEKVYLESKVIPHGPREGEIKALLLECLEHHYGDLSKAVHVEGEAERTLRKVAELVGRYA